MESNENILHSYGEKIWNKSAFQKITFNFTDGHQGKGDKFDKYLVHIYNHVINGNLNYIYYGAFYYMFRDFPRTCGAKRIWIYVRSNVDLCKKQLVCRLFNSEVWNSNLYMPGADLYKWR